jgi:hypothetical protein
MGESTGAKMKSYFYTNTGIGIPASVISAWYRTKKNAGLRHFFRYQTGSGINSSFQSGIGLNACRPVRYSGSQNCRDGPPFYNFAALGLVALARPRLYFKQCCGARATRICIYWRTWSHNPMRLPALTASNVIFSMNSFQKIAQTEWFLLFFLFVFTSFFITQNQKKK